jgi:hypothetical protein
MLISLWSAHATSSWIRPYCIENTASRPQAMLDSYGTSAGDHDITVGAEVSLERMIARLMPPFWHSELLFFFFFSWSIPFLFGCFVFFLSQLRSV